MRRAVPAIAAQFASRLAQSAGHARSDARTVSWPGALSTLAALTALTAGGHLAHDAVGHHGVLLSQFRGGRSAAEAARAADSTAIVHMTVKQGCQGGRGGVRIRGGVERVRSRAIEGD